MNPKRISFSKLLPVFALVVSFAALSVLTTMAYLNLRSVSSNDVGVTLHSHTYQFTVQRKEFFSFSLLAAAGYASRPIQSLNFPAMATEALVSGVMRSWPDSYRPAMFGPLPDDLFAWRGLIFPIYCMPFWWFVGFGVDAVFRKRKLHGSVLLFGSILFGLFAFVGIGLLASGEMTSPRHDKDSTFVLSGLLLWIFLMSTFPTAWIRQFLQTRREKNSPHSRTQDSKHRYFRSTAATPTARPA